MHVPKKAALLALALTVGAGAFLVGTADANSKPTKPGGKVVKEDIVSTGEEHPYAVWRNGKFHYVKVKVKHTVKTYENGYKEEVVGEDEAGVAEATKDIPPVNPALDNDANGNPKQPTREQQAEANAMLGTPDAFPEGTPSGVSGGTSPRRASDPPLGP